MAKIKSLERKNDSIILTLSASREESKLVEGEGEIIILPEELGESLTMGKLGNSNRIMFPKKLQKKHDIELKKKVPADIFEVNNKKFLLVKLEEENPEVPQFQEED